MRVCLALLLLTAIALCQPYKDLYSLDLVEKTVFGHRAVLRNEKPGPYPDDVKTVHIDFIEDTKSRLHIKIHDANNKRWEVPDSVISGTPSEKPLNVDYSYYVNSKPMGFTVVANDGNRVIFDSVPTNIAEMNGIIFEDQYLSITTKLKPNTDLYGLAQRHAPFKLVTNNTAGEKYSFFPIDLPTPEHTPDGGDNMYGQHPFFVAIEEDGHSYGVFLLSSNAMDVVIYPDRLEYRTIGGIFDIYIFVGDSPMDIVKKYTDLVGKPILPPYWSFGLHMSRYGYGHIKEVENVINNMTMYSLPFDVVWQDIDYMDKHKDFTNDPVNYPADRIQGVISKLHSQGRKYIMMFDPAISCTEPKGTYPPLDVGTEMDVWIKNNEGKPFKGKVWPGYTYFPDFKHPNTSAYWHYFINQFHDKFSFDGLWIDMNEPANFCDGECPDDPVITVGQSKAAPNKPDYENPPYVPGQKRPLKAKTLNPTAQHYNGIHYNLHSMYGLHESIVTRDVANKIYGKKKTFLLSRSTFPGSGRYVTMWLGDNFARWSNLQLSIADVLQMNVVGMPFVGPDICGFMEDTTKELCTRWMELGAFYPFARNHNDIKSIPQEPYRFGEETMNATRKAFNIRHALLPYLYTEAKSTHDTGIPFARSFAFQFPKLKICRDMDRQFMLGDGLLITPVLEEGKKTVKGYFPQESNWYDWYSREKLVTDESGFKVLNAPLTVIPVHLRGGIIYTTQVPKPSVAETRNQTMSLIVALDKKNAAIGSFYLDDGESEVSPYSKIQYKADVSGGSGKIDVTPITNYMTAYFTHIEVLGVDSYKDNCRMEGVRKVHVDCTYDEYKRVLNINFEKTPLEINEKWVFKWGNQQY